MAIKLIKPYLVYIQMNLNWKISFVRFLDVIPAGSYGRWTVGLIVLTHVLAYNETGSITVLFASIIATVCGILSGKPSIFVPFVFCFF